MREARRYCARQEEAEEAVQEAMLRAWRSRAACAEPGNPLPWLLAITRREIFRRTARPAESLIGEWPEQVDMQASQQFDGIPARLDLHAAMREFSHQDRELLELRYVADLTQPAVAKRLGMPEGTTKVRLHRLRKRLKERLEEHDPAH